MREFTQKKGYICNPKMVLSFISDLISEPSYFQVVLLLSVACAAGQALGQVKIKGIQLGVTLVFFAGIVLGHFMHRYGVQTDWQMVSLAQNFGLILFVYALGVQVGPGFFNSLKKGGLKLNLYGIGTILATTAAALVVFAAFSSVSFTDAIGLLCGAVTNTPALGAAQQTLVDALPDQVEAANNMATACAVAYPMGVLGVLLCLIVFKKFDKAGSRAGDGEPEEEDGTYVAEFRVSNPGIFGKTVRDIVKLNGKHIIISRIWRDGSVTFPSHDTVLQGGDHVMAVLAKEDLPSFKIVFGEQESTDWNRPDIDWDSIDSSGMVSRHILVTKNSMNGVKIGSLNLEQSYGVNITRVNRAGIHLVAYPGLRLQTGDQITMVGYKDAIEKLAHLLGNQQKQLNNPNIVSIFLGIFLGVLLGALPIMIPGMSVPVKLGIAGGPMIIGIIMGACGPRFHLPTYSTRSANLMLRQMGIVVYLACLGLCAGGSFVQTVFCSRGLMWVAAGLFIAIVPVLIMGFVASKCGRLDYAQNAGMLCAAMANPMALTYANANTNEQEASEAYATVYPISMFVRVILSQILILAYL